MSRIPPQHERAALGALLLCAACVLPAAAQGLPPIDTAPNARALRPALPGPHMQLSFETESHPPARAVAAPAPRRPLAGPAAAFRAELRDEAIEYRFTNRWAFADEQLQGDRPVRNGRARAAENMLADASGAALEVLLRRSVLGRKWDDGGQERAGRPFRQGLRLDSSPSWRLRGRRGLTNLRLDVPLSAHEDLALRCTRPMGGDRCERELGASVRVNPWDEQIRFGFELEF